MSAVAAAQAGESGGGRKLERQWGWQPEIFLEHGGM